MPCPPHHLHHLVRFLRHTRQSDASASRTSLSSLPLDTPMRRISNSIRRSVMVSESSNTNRSEMDLYLFDELQGYTYTIIEGFLTLFPKSSEISEIFTHAKCTDVYSGGRWKTGLRLRLRHKFSGGSRIQQSPWLTIIADLVPYTEQAIGGSHHHRSISEMRTANGKRTSCSPAKTPRAPAHIYPRTAYA